MLKIVAARHTGDIKTERVVMRAALDDDIGRYVLLRAEIHDDNVYPGASLAFWFPDGKIKKDDLIVLYTKSGKESSRPNSSGNDTHFFYWGQTSPVWEKGKYGVVVCETTDWSSSIV